MTLADDVACLQPLKAYFTNVEVKLQREPTYGKLRRLFIVACVAALVLFAVRWYFNQRPIRTGPLATHQCIQDDTKFENVRSITLRSAAATFFQGVGLDAFWAALLHAQTPPLAPSVMRTSVPGASFVDASKVVDFCELHATFRHFHRLCVLTHPGVADLANPDFHSYLVDMCTTALGWEYFKFLGFTQICRHLRLLKTDYAAPLNHTLVETTVTYVCSMAVSPRFQEAFPLFSELDVLEGENHTVDETNCSAVMHVVLQRMSVADLCLASVRAQSRFLTLSTSCPALISIPTTAESDAAAASLQCGLSEWFSMLDFACNASVQFAGSLLMGGSIVSFMALLDALDGCCPVKSQTRKQRRLDRLKQKQHELHLSGGSVDTEQSSQLNPIPISLVPAPRKG